MFWRAPQARLNAPHRYGLGGKSSPMSSLNWIFDNNNMKDSTAIVSDDDISTDYDDE